MAIGHNGAGPEGPGHTFVLSRCRSNTRVDVLRECLLTLH